SNRVLNPLLTGVSDVQTISLVRWAFIWDYYLYYCYHISVFFYKRNKKPRNYSITSVPVQTQVKTHFSGKLWLKKAIEERYVKCVEDSKFSNIEPIGKGGFGEVNHANFETEFIRESTFQTPDVITISYIKTGLTDCEQQIKSVPGVPCDFIVCTNIKEACTALEWSANIDPPDAFLEGYFDRWAITKEYRTYIHIPSFTVSCDASGHLLNFNPHDPDYHDQNNPTQNPEQVADNQRNPYGYTKVPNVILPFLQTCSAGYEPADIYVGDPLFNGISWSQNSDNTCLNVRDNRSSRLSSCARNAQQGLIKMDAPFIYTKIDMTVCCNHQITVDVSRSVFPTTRLYINGNMIREELQKDLGNFISFGGQASDSSKLSKDGYGNFGPPGNGITLTFSSSSPQPPPLPGNCDKCYCNLNINNCFCSDSFSLYKSSLLEFGFCPACSCISQSYDSNNNFLLRLKVAYVCCNDVA
ncbi:41770_t:CDS:2, partial [Gigaspora margarita]